MIQLRARRNINWNITRLIQLLPSPDWIVIHQIECLFTRLYTLVDVTRMSFLKNSTKIIHFDFEHFGKKYETDSIVYSNKNVRIEYRNYVTISLIFNNFFGKYYQIKFVCLPECKGFSLIWSHFLYGPVRFHLDF